MRRLFTQLLSVILLAISFGATAQSGQYGNEWLVPGNSYYKFKVAKAGVYRITRAGLSAAGMPATAASSTFRLFRDGIEVPVFISAADDYLEFFGRGASGVLDKELYADSTWQPNSRISLFTDTACYYLTYGSGVSNARYTEQVNNIPGTPPVAEAYNWATVGNYYKNKQTEGVSYDGSTGGSGTEYAGSPFYSPSFENGEGLVHDLISAGSPISLTLATPNFVSIAGVDARVNSSVTTRAYDNPYNATNTRTLRFSVNNNVLSNNTIGTAVTNHFNFPMPSSQLSASNTFSYAITASKAPKPIDVYGVAYIELVYPRNYDMTGVSMHSFRLSAGSTARYLEFTNVSGTVKLYDITDRKWYAGNASGTTARFLLPVSTSLADREFVLVATSNGFTSLSVDKSFVARNFRAVASQGDYIIISHNKLATSGSGNNLQAYADYRASAAGGLHKVASVDVNELYDHFGYGYDIHPQSIRHYLKYAYDSFATRPLMVNMIGRGLQYEENAKYYADRATFTFPVVPVYGSPGSDVNYVNFATAANSDRTQKIEIGRVSVWDGDELGRYLTKIKAYEVALKTGDDANSLLWNKKVLHIAGGKTQPEADAFGSVLRQGANIISDTLMGAKVFYVEKASASSVTPVARALVDSLINNGLSLISYYGHASPSQFEYNLPDPDTYHPNPRFPVFVALGCDVAAMFGAFTGKTLSEKYTLSSTGGAVAMLATDNYGYTGFLDAYLFAYYRSHGYLNYGSTVGKHTMAANNKLFADDHTRPSLKSSFYFAQIESQILTGDPGIPSYGPSSPDYHVGNSGLAAIPANVNTSLDSFQLRIASFNLGRAIRDTVIVSVKHINPLGGSNNVTSYPIVNLFNSDTTTIWVRINPTQDVGLNKYVVTIDPTNRFSETNEMNNEATLQLFIYNDNLIPVYPYEFAIVHKQNVTLKASTLNPFRPAARYLMELDTTMNFNSPLKLETAVTSAGGVIKWTPPIIMKDSTVYYWRTAIDSTVAGGTKIWSASSFIYLANGSDGWNQSHYYQYKRDGYPDILSLADDRIFKYERSTNTLKIENNVVTDGNVSENTKIQFNGGTVEKKAQVYQNIQVMVIDSISGKIIQNTAVTAAAVGALPPTSVQGNFLYEFNTSTSTGRLSAMRFIENIPRGQYVTIRNIAYYAPSNPAIHATVFKDQWLSDVAVTGNPDSSLYHTLKRHGLTKIDSVYPSHVFIMAYKNGDPTWPYTQQIVNDSMGQYLSVTVLIDGIGNKGKLNSTIIGPAKEWQTLRWRRSAKDAYPQNDSANVMIYGIRHDGTDSLVFTGPKRDTALSFIAAARFPRIRMVWETRDSLTSTPPQLDFWRVLYRPVPEAALNPSLHFAFKDSLQQGQKQQFEVAIENLTELDMDSMLVYYKVINANGITTWLDSPRYKPLKGLDTIHATVNYDPAVFVGANFLFVEANPRDDQPEQYHPNNLGYIPFNISQDKYNPLLDVTFDGVHILSGDIVSAKPFIKIMLKDDNRFLALDTSSLIKLSLKGNQNTIDLPFDGKIARFIPGEAGPNGKNTAIVEIRPDLPDDNYTLTVEGTDRSGNSAGTPQGSGSTVAKYTTYFEVVNKAKITNVLNYPNPFSTSTAFLFTITGSQIPSQFKIQILSVTGKVVREITKNELGPLHIGRNITEYKWDGRDQFGQLLGNGVYMYRVVTSLNGERLEHLEDMDQKAGNNGSKFFKNGYGKMYIMR